MKLPCRRPKLVILTDRIMQSLAVMRASMERGVEIQPPEEPEYRGAETSLSWDEPTPST